MENIIDFYDEIVKLLRELQRQYGVANVNYTAYALERLENCIITCSTVESLLTRLTGFLITVNPNKTPQYKMIKHLSHDLHKHSHLPCNDLLIGS